MSKDEKMAGCGPPFSWDEVVLYIKAPPWVVVPDENISVRIVRSRSIVFERFVAAAWLRAPSNAKGQVARPPGMRLDALASLLFKKRTYETVFKVSLSEMQEEYFEALREGRPRKAQWVWVRGVIGFWSTFALQLPVSITRVTKRLWTISGG